jgi:hypothetical protein
MNRLQRIMNQNEDYEKRVKKLNEYAKQLGVSIIQRVITDREGKRHVVQSDEDLLYTKICQYLTMRNSHKMWIVALAAAIASICSAVAAWVAVV